MAATSAKDKAEIAKFEAEAKFHTANARKATAEADAGEIVVAELRDNEASRKATDIYNHVYNFFGEVNGSTASTCIRVLSEWRRTAPKCNIEIRFNSPGGGVTAGLALFDYIQEARRDGHYVTTSTIGYAASMGGILLQAGDHRVMSKESWILIHEASFGAGGKIGEVEDTVEWIKRVGDRIVDIFAARCQATKASKKLTKARIKANWRRKDWWISSDQALEFGLVDEVR